MQEIIANMHMHTPYSDGHYSHTEIIQAALNTELDVVIVTDHNILVSGLEDYYQDGDRRVLLLIGEEVHDQTRQPQKNHLLIFGAERELAPLAWETQRLLDGVRQAGGLAFLAHPNDPAAPAVGESDISWEDWDVQEYAGIELWNAMSEFKSLLKSRLHAVYYALNPRRIARGPFPESLRKWDELLASGKRVVAIGCSDAHALPASLGPLHLTLFPYEFHFRAINTHLLLNEALNGDVGRDRRLVLEALGRGQAFIGYDLPAPTRGFRFSAQGMEQSVIMGEEISPKGGITLQVRLPQATECNLIKDSETIKTWHNRETCTYITSEPGVYRVEAYMQYQGKRRGWIYSNPIYVKD